MPAFEPGSLDELRTERLVLRRPTWDDLDGLLGMYSDPQGMATLGGVKSEAETETTLRNIVTHWDFHDFGYWTVRDAATGAYAGRAGLRLGVVAGLPEIELGYAFGAEYWGRGIATETAAEIVRAGFEVIGTGDLVCFTTPENQGSRRVMEKLGFRYEKDFVHAGIAHRLCRLDVERWRHELGERTG